MNQKDIKRISLLMVILIAIIVLAYQYTSKKGIFNNTIKLYSFAEDVTGISTDTPILINGFQIGKVSDINLYRGQVLLEFSIDKEVKLAKPSQFFSSRNIGFGSSKIEVENPADTNEFYENKDTVHTKFIIKPFKNLIDSDFMEKIEPTLKELSRSIGKTLQDYGESKIDSTEVRQIIINN